MSKRILVLNVELSGINKYLFVHLRKRGWELTVIDVPFPKILKWWALISTFKPNITEWKRLFNKKLEKLYKTSWAFLRRTKFCQKKIKKLNGKFDIIFQISGMFATYFDHSRINIPYVTYNDYTMALSNKYSSWSTRSSQSEKWLKLERELYKNARLIFATNENARKSFINDYGINRDRVVKVGNGLTLDEVPNYSKTYDGKTILFIGMDFERKGGFVLLEAFKEVRKTIPDARLLIVGPNKEIFKIDQPGVDMGGVIRDREVIETLFKQASIFVMPSLCEPFGLVFLEAMAHKLPCIGTTIDAIPEIIEDGKTGFLAPPEDSKVLAEKIIFLLNNPALMKRMGESGYHRLKQEFNWDKTSEKIDLNLRNILVGR